MIKKHITEFCPHCETEISMFWNTEKQGFHAFCPVCGKILMLCDECQHTVCEDGKLHSCDYNSTSDCCYRRKSAVSANLIPADPIEIRNIAYQRYQVWWCLHHGITVADILAKYSEYWGEVEADSYNTGFDAYFAETGFSGGKLWACMDEFLDSEYLDSNIMRQILSPEQYRSYLADQVRRITSGAKEN